jgi:hypothetical protein
MHTPDWHTSAVVHELLSLHGVLSALAGLEQIPVLGAHVPSVWHWSGVGQVTGLEPTQLPFWQVSVCVHAFPSLQAVPVVGVQVPVAVAQAEHPVHAAPVFCQTPLVSQVCGWAPLHCVVPGLQTPVQAPPLQTKGHAVPMFCQVPLESQTCG